jgi:hypothetical protein
MRSTTPASAWIGVAPTPYSRRNICSLLTLLTMAFAAA